MFNGAQMYSTEKGQKEGDSATVRPTSERLAAARSPVACLTQRGEDGQIVDNRGKDLEVVDVKPLCAPSWRAYSTTNVDLEVMRRIEVLVEGMQFRLQAQWLRWGGFDGGLFFRLREASAGD